MSLNDWCDDDIVDTPPPETPPAAQSGADTVGIEDDSASLEDIAEIIAADPEDDIILQQAIESLSLALLEYSDFDEIYDQVSSSKSVCRSLAIEARKLYPEFAKDIPINAFTENPSGTRYNTALEGMVEGAISLMAQTVKAILKIIWKAVNWILGGKSKDEPPTNVTVKDLIKLIKEGKSAKEEIKTNDVLTTAADKTTDLMEKAADHMVDSMRKNRMSMYMSANGMRIEVKDERELFEGFETYYLKLGKDPDNLLQKSALARSIHHNKQYHIALGEITQVILSHSYDILEETKENRRAILSMMSDVSKHDQMAYSVKEQLMDESKGKEYKPNLFGMQANLLSDYQLRLLGKNYTVAEGLNELRALRSEALSSSVAVKLSKPYQLLQIMRETSAKKPLGIMDNLYMYRNTALDNLAAAAAMLEDLQRLTDSGFHHNSLHETLTEKPRAIVRSELARVQDIVRNLSDIATMIQRDCEDWRRDVWAVVNISDHFGMFLHRLKPIEDADGKYDPKDLFFYERYQGDFGSILSAITQINQTYKRQMFNRVLNKMFDQ